MSTNGDVTIQLGGEMEPSSPWTRHKLKYLDKRDWGDKSIVWNTHYIESLKGFGGLTISMRNLQPFARIRRENTMFCVDPFSIDAGYRGSKLLSSYSSDTHEQHHGDLSAWERTNEVGLLRDIEMSCNQYKLVLHRAVVYEELYIVELARLEQGVSAECPSMDLKEGLSGVLDEEAKSLEYESVGVTLKFVIHRSLNDKDMSGADMRGVYESMRTLNEQLNEGQVPNSENFDWLMAAKVIQRARRDGRFRWAVTIGRAFGARQTVMIQRERFGWLRYLFTVVSNVVGDLLIRDAQRVLGGTGGVVTTVLGATRSGFGVIAAALTLIASALSAGTKRGLGKRSAIRELVLSSGSSFNEQGGAYGRNLQTGGDIAAPLEVGILECIGYKFRLDVAGNLMCVTQWGEVRACVVESDRVQIDARGWTNKILLREEFVVPMSFTVE